MPRGDGTGPAGIGPMTGRAAGYCAGYNVPGFANSVSGRGFWGGGRGGFGGRGRGHRHMYYATGQPGWTRAGYVPNAAAPYPVQMTADQELDALKSQAEYFQTSLENIQQRIQELEKKGKNK